ncbi:MAG TPA: SDR family oxidoreductase [Candidatus Stackebrandtia excrementipullorum]|nr:SDR family oxidoreductase [Candidatus Stackebrandtia excrementipullorum]
MNRFTGKTALITGAAHGIGAACARRLTNEGARVAITDIDITAARATAAELNGATAIACDVTDPQQVTTAVEAAAAQLGGIDIVINNVGVAGGITLEELDETEWHRQVDPTLHGTIRVTQAAIPHLLTAPGGGAVVSISSVNGLAAIGDIAYSAAKAALVNMTQNLAVEYSPARTGTIGAASGWARFNVVAPGTVATRVWDDKPTNFERLRRAYPLGRVGHPDDIAAAVAFLAGPDASWITGITLPVDGGLLAGPAVFIPDIGRRETVTPNE